MTFYTVYQCCHGALCRPRTRAQVLPKAPATVVHFCKALNPEICLAENEPFKRKSLQVCGL